MDREKLEFINLYKFVGAIIIACFLHYRVILLEMFQDSCLQAGRLVTFLMADTSNYVVELFFMLSGFLFAYAYRERIKSGNLCFADFFEKRLKRLVPLLVITTLAMFFLYICLERTTGVRNADITELIKSIILLDSTWCSIRMNPSGWYIPKLLVCYVIAYFLTKRYEKIGRITFVLPVILGVIVRITGSNFPLLEFHMSRAYIGFFIGIILSDVIKWLQRNAKPAFVLVGGYAVAAFPIILKNYVTDWSLTWAMIIFPALIVIGYFSKAINFIGGLKITQYLGKISFDIYLWNCPLLIVAAILHSRYGVVINTKGFIGILIMSHVMTGCLSEQVLRMIGQWWRGRNCRFQE